MSSSLDPLRDLQLPPAPAFWPPAPGWWVLFFFALLASGWGLWWWRRRQRRNAYRRAALAQAQRLFEQEDYRLTEVVQLVRQVARSARPTASLVSLPGPDLLMTLDHFSGGRLFTSLGMDGDASRRDAEALLYGEQPLSLGAAERSEFEGQICRWIRSHRREDLC